MAIRLFLLFLVTASFAAAQDIPVPEETSTTAPATNKPETPETTSPGFIRPTAGKGFDWTGWKRLTPNLVADQKKVWLFPLEVARGRHLKPTLLLTGATAGLVVLDPASGRYFQERKTTQYREFNRIFSSTNTAIGTFAVPLALYGVSLIRRDVYGQRTFVLAGEAVLT